MEFVLFKCVNIMAVRNIDISTFICLVMQFILQMQL